MRKRLAALGAALALVLLGGVTPAAQADIFPSGGWCEAWTNGVHIVMHRNRPYVRGGASQECHGRIARHGLRASLQVWNPLLSRWQHITGYTRWHYSYGATSDVIGPLVVNTIRRGCVNTKETRYRVRLQHFAESTSGVRRLSTQNGRSWWRACGQPGI